MRNAMKPADLAKVVGSLEKVMVLSPAKRAAIEKTQEAAQQEGTRLKREKELSAR